MTTTFYLGICLVQLMYICKRLVIIWPIPFGYFWYLHTKTAFYVLYVCSWHLSTYLIHETKPTLKKREKTIIVFKPKYFTTLVRVVWGFTDQFVSTGMQCEFPSGYINSAFSTFCKHLTSCYHLELPVFKAA